MKFQNLDTPVDAVLVVVVDFVATQRPQDLLGPQRRGESDRQKAAGILGQLVGARRGRTSGGVIVQAAPLVQSPVRKRTPSTMHKPRINRSKFMHTDRRLAHVLCTYTFMIVKWLRRPSTSLLSRPLTTKPSKAKSV